MVSRSAKRNTKDVRRWALKQYIKHKRHNMVYAKPGVNDFVVILDNLKPSFNIGKIFRSGDAFGAKEIHLIGIDYFEVKSAKGSFKWIPAVFHETFEECYQQLHQQGYSLFVLDPAAEKELHQTSFPQKSGFIFGHEEFGISFKPDQYEQINTIRVPQVGRVESLNVSIAASIVMYEYFRQFPV